MTTASPSPSPDGHALNIAHAVQQAVAPDTVLLFGSRATGKHRADSDVDILIIRPDPPQSAASAQRAAAAYMDTHPIPRRHPLGTINANPRRTRRRGRKWPERTRRKSAALAT